MALFACTKRRLFDPARPYNGRAKTSAHLLAACFRLASPCAGFEPFVRIRPTTPACIGFDPAFAASAETMKILPSGLIPEKWTVEKCSSAQVKGAEGNEEKSVQ